MEGVGYHTEEVVRLEGWLFIRSTCHTVKRDLRSLPLRYLFITLHDDVMTAVPSESLCGSADASEALSNLYVVDTTHHEGCQL